MKSITFLGKYYAFAEMGLCRDLPFAPHSTPSLPRSSHRPHSTPSLPHPSHRLHITLSLPHPSHRPIYQPNTSALIPSSHTPPIAPVPLPSPQHCRAHPIAPDTTPSLQLSSYTPPHRCRTLTIPSHITAPSSKIIELLLLFLRNLTLELR